MGSGRAAGTPVRWRARRLVAPALGLLAIGGVAAWAVGAWRDRAELDRAVRAMAAGDHASARDRLARLSARRPGRAEVETPLGACEAALGHVDAALAAWARVPEDAASAPGVALDRAQLALEHGRLSAAEESLGLALGRPGPHAEQAERLAMQLDLFSGRARRLARRFERLWRTADDPSALLRARWLLDSQPFPVGPVSETLQRMSREAPEDDRVWLGLADLATRTGRYDEADALLSRCEARRPDDPDVWQSRLDWALEARRPEAAARALARIPADRYTAAELARLHARLAALAGDAEAERSVLERRVELEPGDAAAWDRLADLSAGAGLADRAAEARRRKSQLDRAEDDYKMLMGRVATGDRPTPAELARAAEALGRRFEARGWWAMHARRAPRDPESRAALARLAPSPATTSSDGRTLAKILPAPTPAPAASSASSGREPAADAAVPAFRDEAEAAGLRFVYDNDRTPSCRLPETMGGGVGLIDFDGDGRLDVYAVQGGPFPGGEAGPGGDRLFRNRGDGTFEDATERSGIAGFPRGFGHGVAVGDYDGDGRPDLFVTRWRSYALYRNRGDGTFEGATESAGLGGDRGWPTSAAFADLDDDGDLDLYVCHYLEWDPAQSAPCPDPDRPGKFLYCTPRAFEAEPDRAFRNDGGRFVDVTAEAGIVDDDGRGLGVVVADLDDDGRVDVYVANDMTANFLYRNLGGFRFEEVGLSAGAASNGAGGFQAGMGVACGDLDDDGRLDLAVTNFYGESTTLYRNLGLGMFADWTSPAGLAVPSRHVLGFGTSFLDANNDGRLDMATANGHVNDFRPGTPYAMPTQLFLGSDGGRLVEASDRAGACWGVPRVGRGLAVGDLDNDGRQDILVLPQAGPLAYFRNLGPPDPAARGHFLTLALRGTRSNRDGVGARVLVTASGRTRLIPRLGGGSFLSACDGRLHVGLPPGAAPPVSVEVRWPSGQVDRHERLAADRAYQLVEGEPEPRPLSGWPEPR